MTATLIAYDGDGNIVATLDSLTPYDADTGATLGMVDFAAVEGEGIELTAVWQVGNAVGSKVWPHRLDNPSQWRVVLGGPPGQKRIVALVHKNSGQRWERGKPRPDDRRRAMGAEAEIPDLPLIGGGRTR